MDFSDHLAPSPTGPRFRALLVGHPVRIRSSHTGRPNVEDAFVSMVREAS